MNCAANTPASAPTDQPAQPEESATPGTGAQSEVENKDKPVDTDAIGAKQDRTTPKDGENITDSVQDSSLVAEDKNSSSNNVNTDNIASTKLSKEAQSVMDQTVEEPKTNGASNVKEISEESNMEVDSAEVSEPVASTDSVTVMSEPTKEDMIDLSIEEQSPEQSAPDSTVVADKASMDDADGEQVSMDTSMQEESEEAASKTEALSTSVPATTAVEEDKSKDDALADSLLEVKFTIPVFCFLKTLVA